MFRKSLRWSFIYLLAPAMLLAPRVVGRRTSAPSSDLTVHEWGTFTSVAGRDGAAVDWLPLTGSTDLPNFVEHLGAVAFKSGLRGTVRMETPVVYFYSPRETSVSVKVGFSKGVITEWYPHAGDVQAASTVLNTSASNRHPDGHISWDSIALRPNSAADFPRDSRTTHYYAAREPSATPLEIKTSTGTQYEKFLFYRGVSSFRVPLLAHLESDGAVHVENLAGDAIPATILFERRGDKLGYRLNAALQTQASVQPPELTANLDSLSQDLEKLLITQGLFPDEARAMLNTWRDSWFEEGSRLFYIVPRHFVDGILPLSIQPAPAKISRVFVGRLELVTPATERAIATALAANDRATLAKFGRFLEPILTAMKSTETDPKTARLLQRELDSVSSAEIALEFQSRNN